MECVIVCEQNGEIYFGEHVSHRNKHYFYPKDSFCLYFVKSTCGLLT